MWCEFWGCPVQGQELDSVILVALFQLRVFHDSMMVFVSDFTCSSLGVAVASPRFEGHSHNILQSALCKADVLENILGDSCTQ